MAELRSVALPLTAALCTAVATVVALRSASGGVVSPSVRPSAPATSHAALYFVLALAFNAAAFVNVEYGNGRIATVNNPLAGSVILTAFAAAFCRAAVRAKGSDKPLPLAWAATLLGVLVAISGVAKHLRLAGAYIASADAGSHHRYLWAVGVAINVFGTMMFGRVADYCLRLIAAKPNVYRVVSVLVLITISTGLVLRGMQAPAGADSSDCARWHTPKAGQLLHRFQLNKTSAYLRMRDGVKLAADMCVCVFLCVLHSLFCCSSLIRVPPGINFGCCARFLVQLSTHRPISSISRFSATNDSAHHTLQSSSQSGMAVFAAAWR